MTEATNTAPGHPLVAGTPWAHEFAAADRMKSARVRAERAAARRRKAAVELIEAEGRALTADERDRLARALRAS